MPGDHWNCRVCGYRFTVEPPYLEDGSPTDQICPGCGTQSGYQDDSPESIRDLRAAWLARGAPGPRGPFADGLTTEERLTHVPPGFEDEG